MTFVITGAARGIGAETARLAASRCAAVVVADVLAEVGQQTVAGIRDAGDLPCRVLGDRRVRPGGGRCTDGASAVATFGGIDVVHNNAGIHEAMLGGDFSFESMAVETFDRVLAVNVRGAFLCAQRTLPYLREEHPPPVGDQRRLDRLVRRVPVRVGARHQQGRHRPAHQEPRRGPGAYGVRAANCYCPASVDTPMVSNVTAAIVGAPPDDGAAINEGQLGAHLVRRIGAPIDVAELVCFLASGRASFVNGVTWLIDGGVLAWRETVDALGMS